MQYDAPEANRAGINDSLTEPERHLASALCRAAHKTGSTTELARVCS